MRAAKKAQVAIEFVMLVGLLFFVMLIFLMFIANYIIDVRSDKDQEMLKDIAYAIQSEINIAAGVGNGYERNFIVPDLLESVSYTINLTGNQIWAKTSKAEVVLTVPSVVGNLSKGGNTIRKTGGVIYLNIGVENDTEAPMVTLYQPADGSTDIDGDVIFSYITVDLDSGIKNCSLIFNNVLNQTDDTTVEGLMQYFYLYDLPAGTYNWSINCTDDSPMNNSALAGPRTFSVVLVYNDPPTTPNSIKCNGGSCNATFANTVSISCNGSTDPDNDSITYFIDAFYAPSNFTYQKAEAESGAFSYTGGYASSSSCTCNSPSGGNCIRDDSWSAGTWASASYNSGFSDTINRIYLHYCSESDGDDSYNIYVDGQQRQSWTTSYESNNWEVALLDDAGLNNGHKLEVNCSRGTSGSYCRTDYVIFDSRSWQTIGNHSQNTTLAWNISTYPDQQLADLRCRAVDLSGSGVYSSYHDPETDLQIDNSGGASGATTNPDFNTSSTGWTGADWGLDSFEVNPTEDRQGSGGDPGGRVRVYFPAGRNDEVGGYWRQSFAVSVNDPSTVTCKLGWKAISYDPTPITFRAYAFLDTGSGEPTIGQQVWNSSAITGTTNWQNVTVDCKSKVTNAGTYYYKLAVWLETDGSPDDGPYEVSFDNVQVTWTE